MLGREEHDRWKSLIGDASSLGTAELDCSVFHLDKSLAPFWGENAVGMTDFSEGCSGEQPGQYELWISQRLVFTYNLFK